MVKRKKARKQADATRQKIRALTPDEKRFEMPIPALMLKILAGILAAIMVAALTMYVLGSMKPRGFWSLAVLVAIIAFFVMPAMRRRFVPER